MAIDPILYKKVTGRNPDDAYKSGPLMGNASGRSMSSWEIMQKAYWWRRLVVAILVGALGVFIFCMLAPSGSISRLFGSKPPASGPQPAGGTGATGK